MVSVENKFLIELNNHMAEFEIWFKNYYSNSNKSFIEAFLKKDYLNQYVMEYTRNLFAAYLEDYDIV